LLQQGNWYFIHGDSTDPTIVRRLGVWFGLFDVLIIDGNHRSYFVKTDYRLYSSMVRIGGLIVFHDSRRDTQRRGIIEVRGALDELGLKGFDVDSRKKIVRLSLGLGFFWTIHRL
ncbi:MAG: class I SAM-dependent methyltransferase, partial [Nitrososphaerota archaeon]